MKGRGRDNAALMLFKTCLRGDNGDVPHKRMGHNPMTQHWKRFSLDVFRVGRLFKKHGARDGIINVASQREILPFLIPRRLYSLKTGKLIRNVHSFLPWSFFARRSRIFEAERSVFAEKFSSVESSLLSTLHLPISTFESFSVDEWNYYSLQIDDWKTKSRKLETRSHPRKFHYPLILQQIDSSSQCVPLQCNFSRKR